jgi:hypothetical protein
MMAQNKYIVGAIDSFTSGYRYSLSSRSRIWKLILTATLEFDEDLNSS